LILRRCRGNVDLVKLAVGLCLAFSLFRPATCETVATPPALGFASFVCWNYPQLPRLRGWKETEKIIATTLTEAYPNRQNLPRPENGSPDQLKDFLRRLPDAPNSMTLVYMAAHQSPSGQWYFPDGSVADWGTLMADLPKLKNTNRIVLLDCCYASSASRWPDWSQKVAPACVFASPANRPTPDLFVFHRRPVDWAVLFPGATLWLREHHFKDPDERVSFFGLVWLEAWMKEASPPQNWNDWHRLAETMSQIAQHASTQINSNSVSDIIAVFPP